MRHRCVVWAMLATVMLPFAAGAVDVHIAGAVTAPGSKQLPGHARLSDAALASPLRDDLPALAMSIVALREWLQPMPVTGRQIALLDPRSVEVAPAENRPVADGDTLYYPTRPETIRVVGAVAQACELPLVPMQDARDYLDACKPSHVADGDWIFVIQPDGRVAKQGVGLWNRSHEMPLAPGAVIYVPLRERGRHAVSPDLNQELAAFLATQPISATEGHR